MTSASFVSDDRQVEIILRLDVDATVRLERLSVLWKCSPGDVVSRLLDGEKRPPEPPVDPYAPTEQAATSGHAAPLKVPVDLSPDALAQLLRMAGTWDCSPGEAVTILVRGRKP